MREILVPPFEARARAFLIDDAHCMTDQAQNALLKSLEEPKATSHVFLVTASPQALLPTIRSRCQVLRFGPLASSVLEKHLREAQGLAAGEARLRAALASGSLGAALGFAVGGLPGAARRAPGPAGEAGRALAAGAPAAAERLEQAEDPTLALTTLRSLLRDLAAARAGAPPSRLLNADVGERVAALARSGGGGTGGRPGRGGGGDPVRAARVREQAALVRRADGGARGLNLAPVARLC